MTARQSGRTGAILRRAVCASPVVYRNQRKTHRGMKHLLRCLIVCVVLVGCTSPPPAAPAGFPATLRWDLVPRWIQWTSPNASVSWPPDDGCAAAAEPKTLAAGAIIDRFGSEDGTFFSPKGESFASRAVPYVCREMDYRVYKVLAPIPV